MFLTKRERNLAHTDPFGPHSITSLFNELWPAENFASGSRWNPPMDVSETDADYKIRLEAPGLGKDEIKVELEDNVLTVSGEKKSETKNEPAHFQKKDLMV